MRDNRQLSSPSMLHMLHPPSPSSSPIFTSSASSSSRRTRPTFLSSASLLPPLLTFLLLFIIFPTHTYGMIDNDQSVSCSPSDGFYTVWSFDFAAGGYYSLDITLQPGEWSTRNHSIQILLASDTSLDPIRSASMDDVCALQPFSWSGVKLLYQSQLGGSSGPVNSHVVIKEIPTTDWVRLLVLNCDADSFYLTYNSVAINPNGEYLSLSDVPYKTLYLAFTYIWSFLLFIWICHLWLYRAWNITLQSLMSLLGLTKLFLVIAGRYYWVKASRVGLYPSDLLWLSNCASILDKVIWFSVLYLVACGWKIIQNSLTTSQRKSFLFMIVTLTLSYIIYILYAGFFIFLMLIFYLLALRMIFGVIVENGSALMRQSSILLRYDIDVSKLPLHAKLQQYRYLQVYLVGFLSIDVIFHLWAAIFLRSQPWIGDMMDQCVSVILCVALAWSFGLRAFNPFYPRIMELMLKDKRFAMVPNEDEQQGYQEEQVFAEEDEHRLDALDGGQSHQHHDDHHDVHHGQQHSLNPTSLPPSSSSSSFRGRAHSVASANGGGDPSAYHQLNDSSPPPTLISSPSGHLTTPLYDQLWTPLMPIPDTSVWRSAADEEDEIQREEALEHDEDDGSGDGSNDILLLSSALTSDIDSLVLGRPILEEVRVTSAIPPAAHPYLPKYMIAIDERDRGIGMDVEAEERSRARSRSRFDSMV